MAAKIAKGGKGGGITVAQMTAGARSAGITGNRFVSGSPSGASSSGF